MAEEQAALFAATRDAHLAQRDASRKLYFIAVGCLHHPKAHLVAETDPEALPALEQAAESGLKFAELSEAEQVAFRTRAVASTRVVKASGGGYQFKPADRSPRRRFRAAGWAKLAARYIFLLAVSVAAAVWSIG